MRTISINSLDEALSTIYNADINEINAVNDEIENGVIDDSSKLVSFRVEQKISVFDSSNQLNIGGFINANSTLKRFRVRYLATLLSNKKENLRDSEGNVIATKKYGIGIALSLDIKDIETKVNGNYGVLAASAKLDFSKVGYKLEVYGITDPTLIANLPEVSGDFSAEVFGQLTEFINSAKTTLKNTDSTKLYPIEVIKEEELSLEKSDVKSVHFGVAKVFEGLSLYKAIFALRDIGDHLNENVVQFIYSYFGLKDAYAVPTETQKQNALKWLNAKYNKISSVGSDGSWVDIDSSFTGDLGDPNSNYIPHPKPSDWSSEAKRLDTELSRISADFSSELKIAAIAEVEAGFNNIVLTRDIALYMDTSSNKPVNSKVIETRYGVGIRLIIKLSNIEFGTEVSFGAVGAISELSLANVEYSISGIGFADRDLLDDLPGPLNITQGTMEDLNASLKKIQNKVSEMNVDSLSPQPYKIRVKEAKEVDPTIEAQAYVFSARQIKDKVKLDGTLRIAREAGLNEDLIKEAYEDFGIIGNDRVEKEQRNEAREWLDFN